MTRYLEDCLVGQVEEFGRYLVSRDEVLRFAKDYDPQPFHLDDDAAAATYFGRLAASGWHTCAMTMRMMVDHWQAEGVQSLGSPGVEDLKWLVPVYPGDVLSVRQETLDVRASRSRPEMGIVRARWSTVNQNRVDVMSYSGAILVRRRPQPDRS
jgi:acyl dehydratase